MSFRSLILVTRSAQGRTTISDAVVKFMMELITLLRIIIYVSGNEDLPDKFLVLRNVRSPFSAARVVLCRTQLLGAVVKVLSAREAERVTWLSEGFVDFNICHVASPFWLPSLPARFGEVRV